MWLISSHSIVEINYYSKPKYVTFSRYKYLNFDILTYVFTLERLTKLNKNALKKLDF